MFRITVHYHRPSDPETFLGHYRSVHSVLAAKLPKLRHYGWGEAEALDGSVPKHFLVAVMEWDSRQDALAALSSPEGQAATADMANFAEAGADVYAHEVTDVVSA